MIWSSYDKKKKKKKVEKETEFENCGKYDY